MPELPEVETTRRGVAPLVQGLTVTAVVVRDGRLRQPVPEALPRLLQQRMVLNVSRRAKYLLFEFAHGTLLVHLGMSGSLRVIAKDTGAAKHDHLDIEFDNGRCLRLRDPRRFGLVLWTDQPPAEHALLRDLGPEPWDPGFTGDYLLALARTRHAAIKPFIMDSHVVVGVGNIYASESLHRAGIHPARAINRVSGARLHALVLAIREVLAEAIDFGGTTLRDFARDDGKPGYFRNQLRVYGRAGEPCGCGRAAIASRIIGQRSSYFCPRCQR